MILPSLNDYLLSPQAPPKNSAFLRAYDETEVFFSLMASADNPAEPAMPLQMEKVSSDLGHSILLFTSAKDPRLSAPYAGISLLKALEMVQKMPDVDGLIIQTTADSCFGASKASLQAALEK